MESEVVQGKASKPPKKVIIDEPEDHPNVGENREEVVESPHQDKDE